MTFIEIYKSWYDHKKNFVKLSSISAYMLLAENHLVKAFSEYTTIKEYDIQVFILEKIQNGLSQKTTKDMIIVLKMILKHGKKHFNYEFEDLSSLEWPTNHNIHKIEVLNTIQYKLLTKYLNENFSFRNLGILISMSTGLRIGEVCGLMWTDIDLDNGMLTVGRTIQRLYVQDENGKRKTILSVDSPKTKNSQRQIPLSPDLMKIFKPLMRITNKDTYILTNEKKPTEPRTFRSYYHELMIKLDLPVIKFHGLRHTFASQCIAANIDVKTVSVLLGHSNVSTTFNLYVHPDEAQKKSAMAKFFKSMK